MKTLAIISLLALLTISGAAYTDQLMTSGQPTPPTANWSRLLNPPLGDETTLSVDQAPRLITLPAVVAAFPIASQISG